MSPSTSGLRGSGTHRWRWLWRWILAAALATGLATRVGLGPFEPAPERPAHDLSGQPPIDRTCAPADQHQVRTLSGIRTWEYHHHTLSDGTVIRAQHARWQGVGAYGVDIGGATGLCLTGGRVQGSWPADTSWETMHGTAGVVLDAAPDATVEDVRVDGYGDSIRLTDNSQNFLLRRVHLSYSRDDCVENDWLSGGTIEDSLLDGCYNAFSARTYGGQSGVGDGSGRVWTIEHTLVRLQPMPHVYKDRGRVPGTAGFFKWDQHAPRLSLVDNVFRADQPADTVGLAVPVAKLKHCSGNTMVWLGQGPYPAHLPSCFTVTRDVGVWNRAVAHWTQTYGR